MVLEGVIVRCKKKGYCRANIQIDQGVIQQVEMMQQGCEDLKKSDFFVTPGFVNSHLHPNQLLDRRLLDGLDLHTLLQKMHTSFKKTHEDRYLQALFVMMDAIKCGATTLYTVASEPLPVINAFKTLGAKGAVSCFFNDQWETEDKAPTLTSINDVEERFAALLTQKTDKVDIHIGSASLRSASNDLLILLNKLAKKYNSRVNMHLSECQADVLLCQKYRDTTPIRLLSQLGVLNDLWNLIHVVAIDDEEIELLAKHKASVIHCPVSNAKSAVGICPAPHMMKAGVNVGLGSDACSNNNTNDITNEAYFALLLHSANNKNAQMVTIDDMWQWMTANGYKMLGKEQSGVVQEGEPADLLLWELNQASFVPLSYGNFESALFYNAPGLRPHTVLIDGKKVVENYRFTVVAEEEIMDNANACGAKICSKLHLLEE